MTNPLYLVDRLVDDAGIDSIVIDNYNGAYAATRYLIGKGHRRIGFISAGLDINVGKERYLVTHRRCVTSKSQRIGIMSILGIGTRRPDSGGGSISAP